MLLLLLLASAFLLLPWVGAGRIIGGREAQPHSRPYMAFLRIKSDSGGSRCGGFLIHPHAVLSAAHCVAGKTNIKITVTLGAHNINRKEQSQQRFHVHKWLTPGIYTNETRKNDIMLLKLQPRARLTKEIHQVFLPSHNEHVDPGTICKVAGWGRTSVKLNETSSVLMEVDLMVLRDKVCQKASRKYMQQSMICVGDKDGKKSTHRGDSGGPLVCNGKVHGIVSFAPGGPLSPKVFTRVSYFEPWIREQLRKFARQDLPESPSSD